MRRISMSMDDWHLIRLLADMAISHLESAEEECRMAYEDSMEAYARVRTGKRTPKVRKNKKGPHGKTTTIQ